MSHKFVSVFIFLFLASIAIAQVEDCTNGIDDDGDMLIDINDPDCDCPEVMIDGLIPNPSFEDFSCCPTNENQLECAVSWVQASIPTTDYWHTCGVTCHAFTGNCAPLPIPDGEGCIGFRDGKPGNSNFKEYAGACLTEQMQVGREYTIDFFTGFADRPDGLATSFDIGLYATTSCSNLPFGQSSNTFGCPTNGPDWVQLDQLNLSGNNEWINTVFTFVADQPYAAIVLGPGCETNPDFNINPYFFFDRLLVAESTEFAVPFSEITGSVCDNTLTLVFENDPTYTFQWYKDGIAIDGATDSSLDIFNSDNVEGTYSLIIDTPLGCFTSAEYDYVIPEYATSLIENICDGASYDIGLESFSAGGFYQIPLIASDGCDSLINLVLNILPHSEEIIEATICEGETFSIFGADYTVASSYDLVGPNAVGCDSTVTLILDVIDPNEGLELGDEVEVLLGDSVSLSPIQFDPDNVSYNWFDILGMNIGDMIDLEPFIPLEDLMVFLEVYDSDGCPASDSILVRVNRDIQLHVPNIFSPNGDGTNDEFLAYGNQSIVGLDEILIFDRWGNLVFEDRNKPVGRNQPVFTWDGRFNGQKPQKVFMHIS